MSMVAVLMLQAALPGMGFDLHAVDPQAPCKTGTSEEIVVCGSRHEDEKYRLRPLPPGAYENGPPVARIGVLGDGNLSVEGEAHALAGGVSSNRLMLRLTKPF